jgi:hypothetical protein
MAWPTPLPARSSARSRVPWHQPSALSSLSTLDFWYGHAKSIAKAWSSGTSGGSCPRNTPEVEFATASNLLKRMAGATRLELATSAVTVEVRCGANAQLANGLCVLHDPARAGDGRRARRAGGITRSRPAVVLPADTPDHPLGNTTDVSAQCLVHAEREVLIFLCFKGLKAAPVLLLEHAGAFSSNGQSTEADQGGLD